MKFTGERYVPTEKGQIEAEHLHRYYLATRLAEGKVVLDIASGEGYGSALMSAVAKKIIGVDINAEAVAHANKKYTAENVEFRHGSCEDIPVDDATIDLVVSFETIEHHDKHDEMMSEIRRVLKSDGVLFISSPNKLEYTEVSNYKNPYHVKELYKQQFEFLLKSNFKNVDVFGQSMIFGSVVIGDEGGRQFNIFSTESDETVLYSKLAHPIYDLALASDAKLPALQNSIYERSVSDHNIVIQLNELLDESREQVDSLNDFISIRNDQIAELNNLISEQKVASDDLIKSLRQKNTSCNKEIERQLQIIANIYASKSWRITAPLRFAAKYPRKIFGFLKRLRWYLILRRCPYFDAEWYLENNPDVSHASFNPLWHYITLGWLENRKPSLEFDGEYYTARYPDIVGLNQPPLVHYWLQGRHENRFINSSLDLSSSNVSGQADTLHQHEVSCVNDVPENEIIGNKSKIIISVIIPTYNRADRLETLIESWRRVHASTTFAYELIFSDDESTDGTVQFLESVYDLPIKIIKNRHGGASRARNSAIKAASGERLLIIGDDIYPDENILNVHADFARRFGSNVAILGVVDWHENLYVNHLMRHITEIGNEQFSYNRLRDGSFVDFRHFYTCNISIDRRMLMEEDRIFDERFNEYGFEDIELGYRLALRGIKIHFTTMAKGFHYHPYTAEKFYKRQLSAGRMAVMFSNIHPGIKQLLGINKISKNALKSDNHFKSSFYLNNLIGLVLRRCEIYEDLISGLPAGASFGIRQSLSDLYTRLFKAMYECGVIEASGAVSNALSISMSNNFDRNWAQYWEMLINHKDMVINFGINEKVILGNAVNSGDSTELKSNAELNVIFDELMCIKILSCNSGSVLAGSSKIKRYIGKGLYYLFKDPRYLWTQIAQRASFSIKHHKKINHVFVPPVYSTLALIVDAADDNRKDISELYRSIFGVKANIYERDNDGMFEQIGPGGHRYPGVSLSELDADILYWPETADTLSLKDQVLNAYISLVENDLNIALISNSLTLDQSVYVSLFRDHVLFTREIANSVFNNELSAVPICGKVIRLLPAHKNVSEKKLADLIGASIKIDAEGFFCTDSKKSTAGYGHRCAHLAYRNKVKPVVFVFPIFLAVGGVERNTIEIMRQLRGRFDFVVITMERLRPEQGNLTSQAHDVATLVIEMSELVRHNDYIRVLAHLKSNMHPDLIWVCNGSPWFCDNAMAIRSLFNDVPIIDQEVYDVTQGWITRYGDPGIQSFDHFIAVNKKIYERFLCDFKIPGDRVSLIYSAIDTPNIQEFKQKKLNAAQYLDKYGLPHDKKIYTFIGRLSTQKRPLLYLSLAESRISHNDECYVIVGDGELSPHVIDYIQKRSLTNVVLIPYIENTLELHSVSSGIIFTSEYEGLPIAMIEALSMGVPVFSTDVGDIGNVLNDYDGGEVVPVTGSNKQMADAFAAWILRRDAYAEKLSVCDHEILDRFSSKNISEQYATCWQHAMARYSGKVE